MLRLIQNQDVTCNPARNILMMREGKMMTENLEKVLQLLKLREMGKDEFFRRCLELANRIAVMVLEVRDQTYHCPHEEYVTRGWWREGWNTTYCHNGALLKFPSTTVGFLPAITRFGSSGWNDEYPAALRVVNSDGSGSMTEVHIFYPAWGLVRSKLSKEDNEFLELVLKHEFITNSIKHFKSARGYLSEIGVDPDNPELF